MQHRFQESYHNYSDLNNKVESLDNNVDAKTALNDSDLSDVFSDPCVQALSQQVTSALSFLLGELAS